MTCTEATPDHNNGTDTASIEAAQHYPTQHTENTVADPAMTHHNANHPYTAAHQLTTHRIAVDHIHTHPTDHQNITHTKEGHTVQDHTPINKSKNHALEAIGRSI